MRALASHQWCGPGSNPGVDAICALSLLLVLSLASSGFSPGTPVFPTPQRPTLPNSNSTRNQVDEEPLCGWCGPGSNPGVDAICGLSLLLVLSLAPRGFSPGTPVSPSHQKLTFQNSNSTRNRVEEEPLCGYATSKSLCIYFIHLKVNLFIDNLIKDFLCKLLHKKHFYLNYWKLSLPLETSGVSLLRIV